MTRKTIPGRLRLAISAKLGTAHVPYIRKHLLAAHRKLKPPLAELSIALVGDAVMAKLHKQFMNIGGPTDVLTFPIDLDSRKRVVTGEIVICVPEARRRSRENGVELQNELLLYAVHGLLHLSGFDDRTAAQFDRMHRTEDRILTSLGIGPVFRPKA